MPVSERSTEALSAWLEARERLINRLTVSVSIKKQASNAHSSLPDLKDLAKRAFINPECVSPHVLRYTCHALVGRRNDLRAFQILSAMQIFPQPRFTLM